MRLTLVLLTVLLASTKTVAEPPRLSPEERKAKIAERKRLDDAVRKHYAAGERALAIRALEAKLALERELVGDTHAILVDTLSQLAGLREGSGDDPGARAALEEILRMRIRLHGEGHWSIPDTRRAIADLDHRVSLSSTQRARLLEARRLHSRVIGLYRAGKYRDALPLAEKALAIRRELLGADHPDTASILHDLAAQFRALGAFAKAEPLFLEALRIRRKASSADHPEIASCLQSVAGLLRRTGRYREARSRYEEALEIFRRSYGEDRPEFAACLNGLGLVQKSLGQTRMALETHLRALEIRKKALGADHPRVATSLLNAAAAHLALGRLVEAEALTEQALAIRKRRLGESHPRYATTLTQLATIKRRTGSFREALTLGRQALEIVRSTLGDSHMRFAETLELLGSTHAELGEFGKAEPLYLRVVEITRTAVGEKHLDLCASLTNLAGLYRRMGRYAEAEEHGRRSLALARDAVGERHAMYGRAANNLATILECMGRYGEAEELFRHAAELSAAGDRESPSHATSLANLAAHYRNTGSYAEAMAYGRQALAIRRRVLGENHVLTGSSLLGLAYMHMDSAEYTEAEPLFRAAYAVHRKTMGANHPLVARDLCGLASLCTSTGDHARAEAHLLEARTSLARSLGKKHPEYASCLTFLGIVCARSGKPGDAERHFREALPVLRNALGADHPDRARCLQSLSVVSREAGNLERAEALLQEVLAIRGRTQGEDHPEYARALNGLAVLRAVQGRLRESESLFRRAVDIQEKALGPGHPEIALKLRNLAVLLDVMGRPDDAEGHLRRALAIQRRILDTTFSVLSERQQMLMSRDVRQTLDQHLSVSSRTTIAPAEAHAPLLAWKGAILAQQIRVRVLARDPGNAAHLAKLDRASRHLAALSLSVPGEGQREAWRGRVKELAERREELERQLARRSAAFRELRCAERLDPDALSRSLPDGVVLVDVVEYLHRARRESDDGRTFDASTHLAAFVISPSGGAERVELGPAEPIAAAIDRWRSGLRRGATREAGRELRRLLWEPIAKHVGDARRILLSPDGALNRLPLAALPGKESDSFLLESVSIAVLPVPRLLPGLLGGTAGGNAKRDGLLLVGDVDYGSSPGRETDGLRGAASRSAAGVGTGSLPSFDALAATRTEVEAIRASFRARRGSEPVRLMGRAEATESTFRREANRHRWLHLATHGFFAPPGLRSALAGDDGSSRGLTEEASEITGYHPGVLSGLALSGANAPPEPEGDDGILTALEVASLDLSNVEVAVLSACETGLGEVAGGEGVLGLQRAFQVAGARTTVTSLWKVPDEATRLLMERFYRNLWERKLPKLEALREAQLWLMREGRSRLSEATAGRGVRVPGEAGTTGERSTRLPPFYWAGFVLSGDWR